MGPNGHQPNVPILGGVQQVQATLAVLLKDLPQHGGQLEIVTADALVNMIRDAVREELASGLHHHEAHAPGS